MLQAQIGGEVDRSLLMTSAGGSELEISDGAVGEGRGDGRNVIIEPEAGRSAHYRARWRAGFGRQLCWSWVSRLGSRLYGKVRGVRGTGAV